MGFRENEDHVIVEISSISKELIAVDYDNLLKDKRLTDLENDFERVRKLLNALSLVDLSTMDFEYLHATAYMLRQFRTELNALKNVIADEKKTDEVSPRVKSTSESASQVFSPVLRILTANLVLCENNKFSMIDVLEEIAKMRDKSLKECESILQEMEAAKKKVESMYAKAVVAKHAGNFNTEGQLQKWQAIGWLIVSAALVAGLVWYSDYHIAPSIAAAIEKINSAGGKTALAQIAISKTVIFSVFAYLIIVSIRNFSAHKHNWTVNNHRRNALSTFETFLECSQDKQVREALLLQVAEAVFKPQPTGHVKDDGDHSSSNSIVEIIRNIPK